MKDMWIELLETINLIKSEFSAKINQQKLIDKYSKLKNPNKTTHQITIPGKGNKPS